MRTKQNSILHWMKKNLFNSPGNTLLTLFMLFILYRVLSAFGLWGFSVSWSVIPENLKLILCGSYPKEELWRIWAALISLLFLFSLSYSAVGGTLGKLPIALALSPLLLALIPFAPRNRFALIILFAALLGGFFLGKRLVRQRKKLLSLVLYWTAWLILTAVLIQGLTGPEGFLPRVPSNFWGGLLLSLIIAGLTILISFPLGLLLALGRRSQLPVFRWFSIGVIEVIRGVPLITLLFLGYLILPMAFPEGYNPAVLMRAMAGIILFHAAYMAETIRGGFQGVPKTQFEAAYSMGFNKFQSFLLVIFPQVIKNIVPVLVTSFTNMLKDTSLISIIGLLDLIGISTAIGANPDYMSDSQQVIVFMCAIYFVLCFAISKGSRKLEARYKRG